MRRVPWRHSTVNCCAGSFINDVGTRADCFGRFEMTAADLTLIVFAACNALRVAAYFPQMFKLARHPAAAASFSHPTWVLFAASNLSTAVYAGMVLGDAVLGFVNAFSALCCCALIGLALWRCRHPAVTRASALRQAGGP